MGPASLPTPLSPTRGHLALGVLPANRLFPLIKTRLASDVCDHSRSILQSSPEGPVLWRALKGSFRVWLRHRRSRRHPAAAFTRFCASTQPRLHSGTPLVSAKPRLFAYPDLDLKQPLSGFPSNALNQEPSSQSFTLSVLSHFSQTIRLASGRNLRQDVFRKARGQLSTRFPVHKTLAFQCLAAPFRWRLVFRRQLEIALESGFRQGWQERLIHFSPDDLWTAVDKSTVCRMGHRQPGTKGFRSVSDDKRRFMKVSRHTRDVSRGDSTPDPGKSESRRFSPFGGLFEPADASATRSI